MHKSLEALPGGGVPHTTEHERETREEVRERKARRERRREEAGKSCSHQPVPAARNEHRSVSIEVDSRHWIRVSWEREVGFTYSTNTNEEPEKRKQE